MDCILLAAIDHAISVDQFDLRSYRTKDIDLDAPNAWLPVDLQIRPTKQSWPQLTAPALPISLCHAAIQWDCEECF
jgi:hypothetical protein